MLSNCSAAALPRLRIKELREARGWTTEFLGKRVGVSPAHVSRVENGVSNTRLGTLKMFADALGIPVQELFARESKQHPERDYPIIGEVGAGLLQYERTWPRERWSSVRLPAVSVAPDRSFVMEVSGDDFSQRYPKGCLLVIYDPASEGKGVRHGDHVVVAFDRGNYKEVVVRELRMDAKGECWLWPRSDSPEHQSPVTMPLSNTDGSIVGIVQAAFVCR